MSNQRTVRNQKPTPAFVIQEPMVGLRITQEFAGRLGQFILDQRPEDKQIAAMAFQLSNFKVEEEFDDFDEYDEEFEQE